MDHPVNGLAVKIETEDVTHSLREAFITLVTRGKVAASSQQNKHLPDVCAEHSQGIAGESQPSCLHMSRLRIQYSTTCTLHVDDNVHSMFQCQPLEDFILGREKSVCEFLGRFSDSHSGTEKGGDFLQGRALVTEIELGLEYCKKLEKSFAT